MDKDERNEHFKEFAHLHYPELSQLFFTLYARISELRPIEEIDAVELEIKTLIAQRAYDLVFHALDYIAEHGSIELDWTSEIVAKVPDLTQWPPTTESS